MTETAADIVTQLGPLLQGELPAPRVSPRSAQPRLPLMTAASAVMKMFSIAEKLAPSPGLVMEATGGLFAPGALRAAACKVTFPSVWAGACRDNVHLTVKVCPADWAA